MSYKKTGDESDTSSVLTSYDGIYSVTNGVYIFAADTKYSYAVTLTIADSFTSATKTANGSSVKKVWSLLKKRLEIVGAAIGKIAELEGVFDIAFQTRFTGGILHPILEPNTDLDDIRTPNTYVGEDVSNYNYMNCPLTSGTFTLEVVGMGADGQVKQRLIYCHKTASRSWERIYYASSWGRWICVSDFDGQLLWDGSTVSTGGYYMTSGHTISIPDLVSKQRTGNVLVFSEFVDGAVSDQSFHTRFIPKYVVASHSGKAQCVQLTTSNLAFFATKYLYIYDDKITGHDNNNKTGTGDCGITYTNNRFVLRYVIGV